ncbi:MAG: dethiobiotin synthase [Balneolaceae bacterium]
MKFPEKIFVTGTDTGIGKTVISSLLVSGLDAGYWKPVQSGTVPHTDTEFVRKVTELNEEYFYPESYRLSEPLSPHAAAKIDGVQIKTDQVQVPEFTQNHLVIEGAGGLIVPLNDKDMIIDLIKRLNIPVLLVARSGLGTLNHTLLSIEALRSRGIELWAVVLNGERNTSNEEAIRYYGETDRLISVGPLANLNPQTLKEEFQKSFSKYAS